MPTMVMKYILPEEHADEFAHILLKMGGRKGFGRTAQLLGTHRDTLMRGLRRRDFGPKVGQRLITALKEAHPDIETRYLRFQCGE